MGTANRGWWGWVGGVLGLFAVEVATAQPIPDETLGDERSRVRAFNAAIDLIEGGATRDRNLFHSFREFNIGEGRGAYFIHQLGIENIFSRVTGVSPSEINGILGSLGIDGSGNFVGSAANLFLINPNGIVFGPNSSLDIGGSFVATTGDGIQFGDRGGFSATNPEVPSSLLTVNPSAVFFNQLSSSGSITNNSIAPAGVRPDGAPAFGLRVPDGENLLLVGGDIDMASGGSLNAQGGRIELGGLAAAGTIGLDIADNALSLIFPDGVARSNVFLGNDARVSVRGAGGGDLVINANQFSATNGGRLVAGTEGAGNGGDITVNAEQVDLIGVGAGTGSGLFNQKIGSEAFSNAGDITVNATTLNLASGAAIQANAVGQGNAGNITIDAASLTVNANGTIATAVSGQGNAGNITINVDGSVALDYSSVLNNVDVGAIGNAGNTTINTGSVVISNGTLVDSSTFGRGNAGNVTINARDTVSIDGISSDGFRPSIHSRVESGAIGNGGSITINAGSVSLIDQARLDTRVFGQGNAGNISVTTRNTVSSNDAAILSTALPSATNAMGNAGNILIDAGSVSLINDTQLDSGTFRQGNGGDITIVARDTVSLDNGSIFSDVDFNAIGNSGRITIDTGSLFLTNGSRLRTINAGQGNAGNVTVSARDSISLSDRASITTSIEGRGNAGNVRLNAGNTISLSGENTGINSAIGLLGVGNAGNILITTGSLTATNSAQLLVNVFGQGNAGNIQITARDSVLFTQRANAASSVSLGGQGNSGNIVVTAGSLTLTDAGSLVSNLFGRGSAGNIRLIVDDAITIRNGGFVSAAVLDEVIGSGGNIIISTGSLFVSDRLGLATTTFGQGNAGNIQITARDTVSFTGAGANASVSQGAIGNGGDITITTGSLFITGGFIATPTTGQGNAGNIQITARDSVSLRSNGRISTSTDAQGNAGNVVIEAGDRIILNGIQGSSLSSIFSTVEANGVGRGGNIRIQTDDLIVRNGAQIQSLTRGQGNAGTIRIDARDRVLFDGIGQDGLSSGAFSTVEPTGIGDGGGIRVTAGSLSLTNNGQLVSSTRGRGNAGNVVVRVNDRIQLRNGGLIQTAVAAGGVGNGGNVTVRGRSLSVLDGSQIGTFVARPQRNAQTGDRLTGGQGEGGDIDIRTTDFITLSGTGTRGNVAGFSSGLLSLSERDAFGPAGDITIQTGDLQVTDGAIVAAGIFNAGGDGGSVEVEADNLEILEGGQILTNTRSSGQAGRIRLDVADTVTIAGRDGNFGTRREQVSRQIRERNGIDRINDIVINEGAGSGIFANTRSNSTGDGGTITINSSNLTLEDSARISAQSQGTGTASDIRLSASEQLQLTNSDITTTAVRSSGGDIEVNTADRTGAVILRGDSDITTNSQGNGGNITLRGSGIIAFDDSDILARSQDARGGNITLAPFFGDTDPDSVPPFDGNDRVDVNADGEVASGTITTPDTSVIQNSLTELPETAIDPDSLVADSCVVRSQEQGGTFTITGAGGLPQRPGDLSLPSYATSPVRLVEEREESWQPGEAIVEPQDVYQLDDGRMVLSRECE